MEDTLSQNSTSVPLWLDCDPGHDDAFAILLAAHHPSLCLLGVSTVHGNASLSQITWTALSVLTAIGRSDVPVHPGAVKPFCRNAVYAPDIHGKTGIDGTTYLPTPAAGAIERPNAVLAMRHALLSEPKGTAWIVATGALTNVALLFATFPEVVDHIKGLSIMGGAIGGRFSDAPMGHVKGEGERFGNVTAWAEFNIYCDPEAAHSLFSNPTLAAKTTLIPLDLTHQVLATEDIQQRIIKCTFHHDLGTCAVCSDDPNNGSRLTLRPLFHDLLLFFAHTYKNVFGMSDGPPLHDPIAVAVLLDDGSCDGVAFDDRGRERWNITVVTEGLHSTLATESQQVGRTVATQAATGAGGVKIPRGMDTQRFWAVVEECLSLAENALLPE